MHTKSSLSTVGLLRVLCTWARLGVVTGALLSAASGRVLAAEPEGYDVVIYGGTSAAVTAAVQVKQMGRSVVIVCPDKHLGGLTSGGLGWTDTGKKEVIGGLARDFYHRIYQEYQKPETWKWQSQESYGNKGQGNAAIDGENRTQWIFEPHVAEKVFEDYVREYEIPVHRDQWLDRDDGVILENGSIDSIRMLSGASYRGKVFLDATYEGDLMAAAGVPYHVGRESADQYGEQWNGVQTGVLHHEHHFGNLPPISPYNDPDDPTSGVLPRISTDPPGDKGSADHRVQAYCFRMCLTDHPENRVAFTKPDGYDASQYELLARIYQAGWDATFRKFDPIPNHKTDTNNHGPMSTDNIGFNYDYPEASYARRREILREHETYQKGWLYFICTDPRVPEDVRNEMNRWGLAGDEFLDNGNWPHQLYVREARRMIGQFVMTENELRKRRPTPGSVGMGSYSIDSHNVQRYITPEGSVQNEGDIGVSTHGPYEIAFASLVPRRDDCKNLLVPVCVSSSHIAFGSIRMEPVFMILGQSAATAAVHAIEDGVAVQDVSYEKLRERLIADGQVLKFDTPAGKGLDPKQVAGVLVDDSAARFEGVWKSSEANTPFFLHGYRHDNKVGDGSCRVTFRAELPAGRYDVQIAYSPNTNRASNVPVQFGGEDPNVSVRLDQRRPPSVDGVFESVGTIDLTKDQMAEVTISNEGTDGYVIADAVRWIRTD
ncbi:FAD-dependent oxidoreductase [Roseiconus nitratireducens]|uniref:FAD-dependent oxidoreductase n=1 Tax=Roseiconus nitratireducens TaxID=2605748 RepID=A0A5M6DCQ6_9BACT|nr:FAD-dependent oxidoreductase [Roseiconus nitratireducens]KAA5545347.1 FAD-dependent oxidoreductase [Roseiconus nitratireducens]